MKHEKVYYTCGMTGRPVDPVDNDVPEEDQPFDTHLPPGWIEVTARRVAPNPDYKELPDLDALVDQFIDEMAAGVPASQRGALVGMLRPAAMVQAQQALRFEQANQEPPFIVQEVVFHLSPDYVHELIRLDEDAFEAAGWYTPPETVGDA